jgi:GDPmannose 4,6-dehydratase
MKAIIFGANGQDGYYLARLLEGEGVEAVAISRTCGDVIGDVSDQAFVENIVRDHLPEFVFHLAAASTTSHDSAFANHAAISTGTINILESVNRHSRGTKVFLAGSAMQFENSGKPIDENTPFSPSSPYAVSRIHSVFAARYYRSLSLKVYVGYLFNHDSPLRRSGHINQKIAMAARNGEAIEVGDINVQKEFNFAGDIIEGAWCLVNQDKVFEAVIGSGKTSSIEQWVELCFGVVGKDWRDYVRIKERYTPEYKILVSKPELIRTLGWRPKVNIEELAKMMVEAN